MSMGTSELISLMLSLFYFSWFRNLIARRSQDDDQENSNKTLESVVLEKEPFD